jgi:putative salt-induced outer membrane protein YdiY
VSGDLRIILRSGLPAIAHPNFLSACPARVFSVDTAVLIDLAWERNTLKHDWKIVAVGCLFTSTALADTVTLLNGDRLSGTLVRLETQTLWLKTAYAGTLKLPWAQVDQIETDAPVRVRLADGTELDGQLQAGRARQVRIRIGSLAETAPLALDRIDAINPPRQGDRTVLSGRASLGGNLARGNTDAQTLHLDGELVARNASQRVTLDGELNEAAQDGVETASNWRVGMKYDHFASERIYYYANTRFDHDGQAGLDLRSTLGAGAGRQLFERDDLKLSLEGGLSLVNEDYAHAADTRFPSARFGARYEQTVWQGRLKLFHNSDLLLSLESLDDYLYQSRTGFRVPMGKGFSLGTQVNFDYDAVPAAGKGSADTALLFKLDYTI